MAYAKEKYTTPKGNLKWAFVDGTGKEQDDGSHKYSVVVKTHKDEPETVKAIAYIDAFWAENKPKQAKANPKTKAYKMEEDDDTGELTGYVLFGMSTKTKFPSGDPKIVKLFTAKAPVREVSLNGKKIGEESLGRGIGSLSIYEYKGAFGTTLFLDALSLSKFVEYIGGVGAEEVIVDDDAEDLDFDDGIPAEAHEATDEAHEATDEAPRT